MMIKYDNSAAIRRHELEARHRRYIFKPPESISEFSAMNYQERVFCAEHYPDLYNHFLRIERGEK